MKLSSSFEVPLPPGEAWPLLLDIERIAPCMPGTELTGKVDENSYKGKVSVKLGPVALSFAGTAALEDVDGVQRTLRIRAKGADSRGRGGASALAGIRLLPAGGGSRVEIDTDLTLTGSIAQYGRGVGLIKDVADQMIQQFTERLRQDVIAPSEPSAGAVGASSPAAARKNEISAFALMWAVLRGRMARLFGRA